MCQECYEDLKTSLGKSIRFKRGVPELSENLGEINSRYNNINILDNLMGGATDSTVVSRLIPEGFVIMEMYTTSRNGVNSSPPVTGCSKGG